MQRYSIIGDLIRAGFGGVIPVNNVTQKQNLNLFFLFCLGKTVCLFVLETVMCFIVLLERPENMRWD